MRYEDRNENFAFASAEVLRMRYEEMNEKTKREIRMFGCTIEEMREAVEESLEFRFRGAEMMAVSIMSDCQEMLAHDKAGLPAHMVVEDVRQALNRAKWILMTYRAETA